MNTRRSYLDTLNAGRQRRPEPAMDELDRTLASLEGRGSAAARVTAPRPRADQIFRQTPQQPAAPAPLDRHSADLRALASEMERARRQEDSVGNASRIAAELKAMREELRQQMGRALKSEFDSLRQDIGRLASARPALKGDELGAEFERLSDAVRSLSERGDDRSVNLLRLELEQVKHSLDSLAREDTLKSVDRRWDEFDRKWTSLETRLGQQGARAAGQPDLNALSAQIERIGRTVDGLPESLSLRALDERLRLLSTTVDHFTAQYASAMPEAFGLIEQRLDEISRAIAASASAVKPASFDPEPFERIEARVGALARQIDELMADQTSVQVADHLTLLSRRVDAIADRVDIPEALVERLGHQLADITARLDHQPAPAHVDAIFRTLDERFADLSEVLERRQGDATAQGHQLFRELERRQGDAMEQGHQLFRELERRLDEVAQGLEARGEAAAAPDTTLLDAIEQRFAALTARLNGTTSEDRQAILGLEARLDDISHRLEESARRADGIDPEIIRSLESQVASLSAHLTRPGTPLPELEDLAPRLDHIERSIAGNREAILDAARRAAQDAIGAVRHEGSADPAAMAGLAGEVRALESMTRKSDERNARTFEAIHDMLIKVVDRLGSLEQGPGAAMAPASMAHAFRPAAADHDEPAVRLHSERPAERPVQPRSPAEAAAAAATHALGDDRPGEAAPEGRRSMLSGLTRAFRKDRDAAPEAEIPAEPRLAATPSAVISPVPSPGLSMDEPLDPEVANQPLEPGSGAPDLTAIVRRVRDEASSGPASAEAAKSDFIAAARRAAQAAAAEAQSTRRGADALSAGSKLKLGDLLRNRRKGVLMAATAMIVLLAGWQIGSAFLSGGPDPVETATQEVVQEPAPLLAEAMSPELDENDPDYAEAPLEDEEDAPAVRVLDSLASAGAAASGAVAPVPAPVPSAAPAVPPQQANAMPARPVAASPFSVPVEAGPVALREAAEGGDPKAMFEIASRYAEGRGVGASLGKAAEWYRHSAELGYAPAQYRLGNLFEKGNGVDRDPAQAVAWYEKAAKQGNASAMHNLAVLHAMGATGATDNDAAARWFLEAAELGVTDSQYNLGILAAKGAGVPQSLEESYKWFALVAKAGDRDAAAKRDEVGKALRPEQLEKAKAAAELWKARAVDPETNVVDIPEEWTEGRQVTASVPDMRQAIRNIQAILNKNGYDAGPADGLMGNKTRSAIMAFQADNGMNADGEVNDALVKTLLERR